MLVGAEDDSSVLERTEVVRGVDDAIELDSGPLVGDCVTSGTDDEGGVTDASELNSELLVDSSVTEGLNGGEDEGSDEETTELEGALLVGALEVEAAPPPMRSAP